MTTSTPDLTPFQLNLICKLTADTLNPSPPRIHQTRTATQLMREGATVPFIARYRKERTGGLDEVQLRAIEGALKTFATLEARR